MREHLFRGKRIDEGKWVEGCLILRKNLTSSEFCCIQSFFGSYNNVMGGSYPNYIVYPETIGQYTGLKYAHDKKAFEDDFFEDAMGCLCRIIWDAEDACFSVLCLIDEIGEWGIHPDISYIYDAADIIQAGKYVGNIHDNPELLGNPESLEKQKEIKDEN